MKTTVKQSIIALITAGAFTLSACNTVKGVGKDLESAGDAAERTAEDITD